MYDVDRVKNFGLMIELVGHVFVLYVEGMYDFGGSSGIQYLTVVTSVVIWDVRRVVTSVVSKVVISVVIKRVVVGLNVVVWGSVVTWVVGISVLGVRVVSVGVVWANVCCSLIWVVSTCIVVGVSTIAFSDLNCLLKNLDLI